MRTDKTTQQTKPNNQEPLTESYEVLVGGVREMARRLNISERSGYRGVASGQLPGVKIGSKWIVPTVAFQRFLNGNWTAPSEAGENENLN